MSMQEAIDRAEFKVALLKSSTTSKAKWIPDLPKILRTATEIASAMSYLHSKEVLHAGQQIFTSFPCIGHRHTALILCVSDGP